jgi:hypothetical protein
MYLRSVTHTQNWDYSLAWDPYSMINLILTIPDNTQLQVVQPKMYGNVACGKKTEFFLEIQ